MNLLETVKKLKGKVKELEEKLKEKKPAPVIAPPKQKETK